MNKLQLESKETDSGAIVFLAGYLNESGGESLEQQCHELLGRGVRTLALDFAGTEMVNSIGISYLLDIIEGAQKSGMGLEFSRVPDHIVELFELLGISSRVPVKHL